MAGIFARRRPVRQAVPVVLVLAAAAWGPCAPAVGAAPVRAASDPGLQSYVIGRIAAAERDHETAVRAFASALRDSPADVSVRRRAFDAAMLVGDRDASVRLARALLDSDDRAGAPGARLATFADTLPAMVLMAEAAARRDWRTYERARARFSDPFGAGSGPPIMATILEAHGLAGRGQHDAALALLAADEGLPRLTRSYFAEHRAHVLALARRWPQAAAAYAALLDGEAAASRLRVAAAAAALEAAAGEGAWRARAIATLGAGPPDDPLLADARARLVASPKLEGRRLGGLPGSAADAVALLFVRLAADLVRERNPAPAGAFARLASFAAPAMPEAWLVAAETLVRQEQPALALAALERIPAGTPLAAHAAWRRAIILSGEGRHEEARAALEPSVAAGTATLAEWQRLAEIERAAGNHAGAVRALDRAIALIEGEPGAEHATLFFLRGASHEQAGSFDAAEPDLRRALALQPANAIILNYLGYSLLDRGLKLDEAEALIARAFAAEPENGAIIDSMGWAAFRRGRYEEAVALLEKARAAEPSDPTVADHLGDALWRVGRRIEARHAWNAARALDPPAALAEKLDAKLRYGLDAALALR